MIIPILSTIVSILKPTSALIERSTINAKLKSKLLISIQEATSKLNKDLLKHQKDLISKEMDGNWFQRSWRPAFAWVVILIILNNYLIIPYLIALGISITPIILPDTVWYLFTAGFSGYVIARSSDKKTKAKIMEINKKAEEMIKGSDYNKPSKTPFRRGPRNR